MDVQWYPGHMTKASRMMEENIRLVDLVIELVDARIPLSSRNPDIDALCTGKGRVVLLCKADLADPAKTEEFTEYFRKKGILAVAVDARERRAGEVVRRYVQEAGREKIAKDRARGIVGRPLRAMVAGIPNVGKSTFINSFAGRASTKTGNKPGVTRGKQWIPLVGAIRDEILDKQELAVWLINYLQAEYPGSLQGRYLASEASEEDAGTAADPEDQDAMLPPGYALLLRIARARSLLMKGGEPDADRAAAMLIDDCKNGRIGRISLDRLQDAEQMEEERLASAAARKQEKEKENEEARKKAARSAGSSRSAAGKSSAGGRRPAGKSGDSGRRPAGKSVDGRRGPAGKNGDSSRRPARKDHGAGRGKSGSSRRRGT